MKKRHRKVVALMASLLMLMSVFTMGIPSVKAYADETSAESYYAFVAIGAGDGWEYGYAGKTGSGPSTGSPGSAA